MLYRRVREGEEVEDTFGRVEGGGATSVQRGWLTEEMVIQFKLRAGGLAVWKRKYAGHRLWVKMTPLDQDLKVSQVWKGLVSRFVRVSFFVSFWTKRRATNLNNVPIKETCHKYFVSSNLVCRFRMWNKITVLQDSFVHLYFCTKRNWYLILWSIR